jgi:hypothetical protein
MLIFGLRHALHIGTREEPWGDFERLIPPTLDGPRPIVDNG